MTELLDNILGHIYFFIMAKFKKHVSCNKENEPNFGKREKYLLTLS